MIDFSDLKRTKEPAVCFVPMPLAVDIMKRMEEANIPFQLINWRNVDPKYDVQKSIAKVRFEQAGYGNTTCMGILIACVDPSQFFQKCCLFFGDTIDPDYKAEQEYWEAKRKETYETCYKDWLEPGQIPVRAKS